MAFRMNTYNEGAFGRLIPVARQQVAPGQSVTIDCGVSWETPTFLRNLLSGGVAHLYAFYVPFRLIWDQWVEFIAEPDSGLSIPQTGVVWDELFEPSATRFNSVFARRAYKLIYNQFFCDDNISSLPYVVDDDAVVAMRPTKTLDQMRGKMMAKSFVPEDTFDVDVTGTDPNQSVSIPLNEFARAMAQARTDRRAAMTGDKYVDAMARLGVKLDWRVQMAPEFLGQSMMEFGPKDTKATFTAADPAPAGSAVVGRSYSKYSERMSLKTGRRFFAEHGIILTLLNVRPHIWASEVLNAPDAEVLTRDRFWLGTNQVGIDEVPGETFGHTSPVYLPRLSHLRQGTNLFGKRDLMPWVNYGQSDSYLKSVYPDYETELDAGSGLKSTSQVAVVSRYSAYGPSPVRDRVV